ncbi:MAG: 4a-hydroxytetrahydrobiopterin dehydratase [Gemmatimonadota bacterium]
MPLPKLSDIEIQRELNTLEGWSRRGEAIVKTFEFATFTLAIAWVTRVAEASEAANHHPDLDIRYTRVLATLSTHDSGGVTARDFVLARAMDALAKTPDDEEPVKRA